jgi:hypothetical protein
MVAMHLQMQGREESENESALEAVATAQQVLLLLQACGILVTSL